MKGYRKGINTQQEKDLEEKELELKEQLEYYKVRTI